LIPKVKILNESFYDVVILDEINGAVDWELLSADEVAQMVSDKPAGVDLILTGRNAHPKLVQVADVVTEMRMIKHPFRQGIAARRGIEY